MRVALGCQQVGQFLRAGGRVFGPLQAYHHQSLQFARGQIKRSRVVLAGVVIHRLLADGKRHAFFNGCVKVNQPGPLAAQQGLGRACVQPVGREQQLVRNALAPHAKHLAPPCGIADGAPAVWQQHGTCFLGFGADGLQIGKLRLGVNLAQPVKVRRRGGADHPGGAPAPKHQRQVARDACGTVVVAAEARLPVIHAALQFVTGQCLGVLDGVQVVGVDAHAQAVGLPRREIAGFKPHRQKRDGLPAVHRLNHLCRIKLTHQTVGHAVNLG